MEGGVSHAEIWRWFIIMTLNMNLCVSRILILFRPLTLNYKCSTESSVYSNAWLKWDKRQDWSVGCIPLFKRNSIRDMLRANGFQILRIQGSAFNFMPQQLKWLNHFFAYVPSIASRIVILAKKIDAKCCRIKGRSHFHPNKREI